MPTDVSWSDERLLAFAEWFGYDITPSDTAASGFIVVSPTGKHLGGFVAASVIAAWQRNPSGKGGKDVKGKGGKGKGGGAKAPVDKAALAAEKLATAHTGADRTMMMIRPDILEGKSKGKVHADTIQGFMDQAKSALADAKTPKDIADIVRNMKDNIALYKQEATKPASVSQQLRDTVQKLKANLPAAATLAGTKFDEHKIQAVITKHTALLEQAATPAAAQQAMKNMRTAITTEKLEQTKTKAAEAKAHKDILVKMTEPKTATEWADYYSERWYEPQTFMAVGQARDGHGKWTKGAAIEFDKNPLDYAKYKDAPDHSAGMVDVAGAKVVRDDLAAEGRLNADGRTTDIYHVTMIDNVATIKEHGLVPGAEPAPGQTWAAEHSQNSTYFHTSKEGALADLERANEESVDFVIVTARIPVTPKTLLRFTPDEDTGLKANEGVKALVSGEAVAFIGGVPAHALSIGTLKETSEPSQFMAQGQPRNADGEWSKGGGAGGAAFGSQGAVNAINKLQDQAAGPAYKVFADNYFGTSTSFAVNNHLRGVGESTFIGKATAKVLLANADKASVALPSDFAVTRSIRFKEGVPADFRKGAVITDKGFTSTTTGQNWADYHSKRGAGGSVVRLNIVLPKGTKVIPNKAECELVIKPPSKYEITGRKGNTFTARLVS